MNVQCKSYVSGKTQARALLEERNICTSNNLHAFSWRELDELSMAESTVLFRFVQRLTYVVIIQKEGIKTQEWNPKHSYLEVLARVRTS